MDKESGGPLKVGRISIYVETSLGLDLKKGIFVYILEEDLNALASSRPNGYLKMVEEISVIIKEPDFARQLGENELEFIRFYWKNGAFSAVKAKLHFDQGLGFWTYKGIENFKPLDPSLCKADPYIRVEKKSVTLKKAN